MQNVPMQSVPMQSERQMGGSSLGRTAAAGLESGPQEAKLANYGIIPGTHNTLTHAAAGSALGGVAADSSSCLSSVGWLGAPLPEGSRACCDGAASPAAPETLAWSKCCSICATAHRQSSLLSWSRDAIPPNACGVFRFAFCIDFSPVRRELPPELYEEHAEAAGLGDRCMLRAEPQWVGSKAIEIHTLWDRAREVSRHRSSSNVAVTLRALELDARMKQHVASKSTENATQMSATTLHATHVETEKRAKQYTTGEQQQELCPCPCTATYRLAVC